MAGHHSRSIVEHLDIGASLLNSEVVPKRRHVHHKWRGVEENSWLECLEDDGTLFRRELTTTFRFVVMNAAGTFEEEELYRAHDGLRGMGQE